MSSILLQAVLVSTACVRSAKQGRKHVHVRNGRTNGELLTFDLSSFVSYPTQGGLKDFPELRRPDA